MIDALQAAHALQTCAVAIVGVTLVFKILPMVRLDCFRQNMFFVRDELFDYAAAGNVSFEDPAYILLRHQMNGMIRYGHQLTLFRVMVTRGMRSLAGEDQTFSWHDSWEKALAELKNDDVRQQLRLYHARSTMTAAKHLITGSFVLWFLLAVTALVLFVRGAAMGVGQLLNQAINKILSGPIDQRVIEEEAVCAFA